MPEKYVRQGGLPILLRHTGPSTLPEKPPVGASGRAVVSVHDAGLQSSVFCDLLGALRALRGETGGRAVGDADACALAFDLPGHGRSGGLDALPSIEAMSECARSVAGWCLRRGRSSSAMAWARSSPSTGCFVHRNRSPASCYVGRARPSASATTRSRPCGKSRSAARRAPSTRNGSPPAALPI